MKPGREHKSRLRARLVLLPMGLQVGPGIHGVPGERAGGIEAEAVDDGGEGLARF